MFHHYRTEGVSSLWSGLSPTLVLAIPTTMLYFTAYEQLKAKISHHAITLIKPKLPLQIILSVRYYSLFVERPLLIGSSFSP